MRTPPGAFQKLLCFLALLGCNEVTAQDAKVRVSLAAKGDLWVGQRVVLVVELLAPGYFASAPAFALPDPPGLLLVPPAGSPLVSTESAGGISYTVQRHELSVFARHSGSQTIPPLTVRFQFKRQPLDKDRVPATVKSEPVQFTTKVPPGAEKLGSLISARDLKALEAWKPEPGKAKAGDVFTRTITFTAPEIPAMAFPPFPAGKIEGVGIYQKAPVVLDHSDRGELKGERRDTIAYVCEQPGRFTIPAARLTWWDLDAQKLQVIDFPVHTFDVAPNPAMAPAAANAEPDRGRTGFILAGAALGLAVLSLLLWRTRALWQRLIDIFRPVHLAPLNPSPQAPEALQSQQPASP